MKSNAIFAVTYILNKNELNFVALINKKIISALLYIVKANKF